MRKIEDNYQVPMPINEETEGATMLPPAIPSSSSTVVAHQRTPSTVLSSPHRDGFKRMSTDLSGAVSVTASTTSTRPNSMATTFTEEPSEVSSPGSRRSLTFEPANSSFLTAVAAQERRVLELKDELQKAEAELVRLKSQWAQQEAVRKRQEVRSNTEAMRPLTSPTQTTPTAEHFPPPRASLSFEEERKKAIFTKPRIPERRVFTGRHARTLSLLSPGALTGPSPSLHDRDHAKALHTGPFSAGHGSATPNSSNAHAPSGRPHADSQAAGGAIVSTGKQLVGDLREGLWSFWDDLRQATVGDEILQEPSEHRQRQTRPVGPSRNSSSGSSSMQTKQCRRISRSPHTRSATIACPPSTPANRLRRPSSGLGIMADGKTVELNPEDGGWSNWDSPAGKTQGSTTETAGSGGSTPRTSVSSAGSSSNDGSRAKARRADKLGPSSEQMGLQPSSPGHQQDAIPWPSLQKLSPGNLQRTASHLMKEWERSLTPPAEDAQRDWIDKYIDGPRKRKSSKVVPAGQAPTLERD